jgi:hypothetical protein
MKLLRNSIFAAAMALGAIVALPVHAADTYTSACRIVQMPTGSNDTTWGTKANAAFAMLEACATGAVSVDDTSANVTLTVANNAADQARNALIVITGTPGTTRTITVPNVAKTMTMANASDSPISISAGAGTTVTLAASHAALLLTDGATNVAQIYLDANVSAPTGITPIANGGTASSTAPNALTALGAAASASTISAGTGLTGGGDLTANRSIAANFGTTAGTIAQGNDSRLVGALQASNNLGDITSGSVARANIQVSQTGTDTTYMYRSNNLADVANAATARSNLSVAAFGGDTTYAFRANNLGDLTSETVARANLGLGSAAVQNTGAFDAAGAAATAQSNAETFASGAASTAQSNAIASAAASSNQRSSNLSDVANAATARTNLGFTGGTIVPIYYGQYHWNGSALSTVEYGSGLTVSRSATGIYSVTAFLIPSGRALTVTVTQATQSPRPQAAPFNGSSTTTLDFFDATGSLVDPTDFTLTVY